MIVTAVTDSLIAFSNGMSNSLSTSIKLDKYASNYIYIRI